MGNRDAVVVGYDVVSPLGTDLEQQWDRALAGRSGIGPLTRFSLPEDFPVSIAGEVDSIDHEDYPFLSPRHRAAWSSPVFSYSLLTAVRGLKRSGIEITGDIAARTALTYSSAIGGLDAVLNADRRLMAHNRLPHPYANPNSCINMIGGKIAIATGAKGPITSTISACATGLTSVIVGAMFLAQGMADVALCGAVDFALVEPILAGFYTMNGVYTPKDGQEDGPPEAASRPFSINRRGFVVSEGAGAIILATREFAHAHGIPYAAELAGWGMTSDAHHFVAPHLDTVSQCIQDALTSACIGPETVDVVNAHAASTKIGDLVEFEALERVFKGKVPPVTANKSLIGHAMGASSAIETIYALRAMEEEVVPPTINYTPDPAMKIDCIAEGKRNIKQEFILKNACGFGGCNACAVFKKAG